MVAGTCSFIVARCGAITLTEQPALGLGCALRLGDTNVADDVKRWQDMSPNEQAVVGRQISGTVNRLQFRVQDLEDAVKDLHGRLKKQPGRQPMRGLRG